MDAFALALYYLERRARTEKELRDKLARKQVPADTIETILTKLKGLGYINDQKFAQNFQRYRNDFKPVGLRRLKMELYQKGVPKEIIQSVSVEKDDEERLALEAAKTRLRQYSNLDSETFKRRMIGFLSRRGFTYDTIKRIMTTLDSKENNE